MAPRVGPERRNVLFIAVYMAAGVGTPLAATGGPMRTWRLSGRGSRCLGEAGFTVMELFVVIGLILIATIIISNLVRRDTDG